MKVCSKCGQAVAETVDTCPACGADVAPGRETIDDFKILEVLHEGYSSTLCKARRDGETQPVMIRIFSANSGVDARLANRLKRELEELKKLPDDYFVRHLAIRQSTDGRWYRRYLCHRIGVQHPGDTSGMDCRCRPGTRKNTRSDPITIAG